MRMPSASTVISRAKNLFGGGGALNAGFAAWQAMDAYNESRQDGSGRVTSAVKGVADAALWWAAPMQMMALEAVSAIPGAAVDFAQWQASYRRQLGREQRQAAFQSAAFQDTQATYTMRQAGMAIAERSRYNTQQAMLGREASYMKK